jgi:hypothetical protein
MTDYHTCPPITPAPSSVWRLITLTNVGSLSQVWQEKVNSAMLLGLSTEFERTFTETCMAVTNYHSIPTTFISSQQWVEVNVQNVDGRIVQISESTSRICQPLPIDMLMAKSEIVEKTQGIQISLMHSIFWLRKLVKNINI